MYEEVDGVRYMNNIDEIIEQIKILASSVTENTYSTEIKQGYELLVKLHDLGVDKEIVYRPLFQYLSSLEEGISYNYITDILDYVVGWCSPRSRIWSI